MDARTCRFLCRGTASTGEHEMRGALRGDRREDLDGARLILRRLETSNMDQHGRVCRDPDLFPNGDAFIGQFELGVVDAVEDHPATRVRAPVATPAQGESAFTAADDVCRRVVERRAHCAPVQ